MSAHLFDADHSWFKQLFELSPDPTWIIDDNRFVACNEAAVRTLGYASRAEFLNVHPSKLSPPRQPDGEDSYGKAERMMAIAKDHGLHRFEWMHTKADGINFVAEVTLSAIELRDQHVIYCVWRDISERKIADAKIQRLTQLYAALSQCNQAIVRCASEGELLPKICQVAVQFGAMKMAWIGLVNPDTRMVRPVASYGAGADEYLQGIEISLDADNPLGRGPAGIAIRENQPVWCQDFLNDPRTAPWHERGAHVGWRASAALPLHRNSAPIGAFTLYAGEVGAFDEAARSLLTEMAADISFALDNIARELQRRQTEEEIQFKNTILQTQQETSLDAMLVVDENGRIISCNQQFIDLWRLSPQLVSALVDAPVLQSVVNQIENPEAFLALVHYLNEHRDEKSREEILLKDGRTIDRYSAPVVGANRKYYGRVWYFRDITERKQAEENLRLFRTLLDSSSDAIEVLDPSTMRFLDVNETNCRNLGYSREEMLALSVFDIDPVITPELGKTIEAQLRQAGSAHFETVHRRKDGSTFPVEVNTTQVELDKPYLLSIARDITERKSAEARIKYLNRVYAMLSGINALIVRVRDRQDLFKQACRIAVEQGGFGIAWIGEFDPATLDVTPVAWAGFESKQYIGNIKSTARADLTQGKGVVGQAIRERRAAFTNDLAAEENVGGERRKEAVRRGYRSLIALPLALDDGVFGTLSLFTKEPDFFNEAEVNLLTELADNIAFAIRNIDTQQKLDNLARIRAVSGEANAAIIRIHNRDELLRQACRIAAETGGFSLAWVALVDRGAMQLKPLAYEGFGQDYVELMLLSLNETDIDEFGLAGRAVCEKKPMIIEDMQCDPRILARVRREAAERNFHSMVALPLLVSDKVEAVLAIYANEIGFFNESEMKLLLELAGNISFALEHIEKEARINYLAYYDELTGLANRSLFLERVALSIRSAMSGGHKLALFLIDLERFKNINDSLGRPAGEALLRQVAEWLTRKAGDASLVARLGADHFAAMLPEVKQDGDVAKFLEKTIAEFLNHPFNLNDTVFRIAAKFGVALYPDDGADADTLFRNAEAALKKAKASGERYLFYTQKMTKMVAAKLTLENQLREAIDNEEFVLHYQPKVNLVSGKVISAEALIRWNDPRTGLVPPGKFIPVLEETGLIYEVGRWALRQAIKDYLRWRAAGLPAVRIAVNVSPLQLRNRGFVDEIKQVISIDAHAPAGLELEITESLIMADIEHNIASLQAIKAMGISIAIDDFGTGFSSLSYLARLPVDTLKIDRSFVIAMTDDPEGLALVTTIINLAHSLKLKVVAEGVETEEQSRQLRLLNCDEMQGFLFSKPVPGETFEEKFLIQ